MSDLVLYGDTSWISPWVFHALVALEEKRLPYRLELLPLPIPAPRKAELVGHTGIGRVPILAHGDVWIGESLAISEYLAERFPVPEHPRIFPADLPERARARQIMSYLRTSLFALREARPTTSVFHKPVTTPLHGDAASQAEELVKVAAHVVAPGRATMAAEWCIADADLALALMRLIKSHDPVPAHLVEYAEAQWARPSIGVYLHHAKGA